MNQDSSSPLWGARFSKSQHEEVQKFGSSIQIDKRLFQVDIMASIAHVRMLEKQQIIHSPEAIQIVEGLKTIETEFLQNNFKFSKNAEDIHGEIERRLVELIGPVAKKMHTARSRNDQVSTDTRLYLAQKVDFILSLIAKLQTRLLQISKQHSTCIMPGMTHMQHAQPVSLAHHFMSYFWMLERDYQRLTEGLKRILCSPLGAAALAGTSFSVDRNFTAHELGFLEIHQNSMDAVSDRDFVLEFLSHASIGMMHLSRLSEELIIWSTPEFSFIELSDSVTTGSSIMPQKKNPDMLELIRGRVGPVYGALIASLTMMKALPLSYNRDMQEDKESLFKGIDTWESSLSMMDLVLSETIWNTQKMAQVLKADFSNATDLADDLVLKGINFRDAHEVVGAIVRYCLEKKMGLEDLSLAELQKFHSLFDEKSLAKLNHIEVLNSRNSLGGTSPKAVLYQIEQAQITLNLKNLK